MGSLTPPWADELLSRNTKIARKMMSSMSTESYLMESTSSPSPSPPQRPNRFLSIPVANPSDPISPLPTTPPSSSSAYSPPSVPITNGTGSRPKNDGGEKTAKQVVDPSSSSTTSNRMASSQSPISSLSISPTTKSTTCSSSRTNLFSSSSSPAAIKKQQQQLTRNTDRTGLEDPLSESEGSDWSDESETDFEDNEDATQAPDVPPEWRKPFQPADSSFQSGSTPFKRGFGVDIHSAPLDILKKFITPEIIANICLESNKHVAQVKGAKPHAFANWKDVTSNEMWRFLAINLAMGLVKKSSLKCYWSQNKTISTPFFGTAMGRNRFESILSSLHLHDKLKIPPNCRDRYIKLGTFFRDLLSNFRSSIIPGEFLCLDESLLGFKGRLSFKQFNPMKRSRFGMLFYILCDCKTGIAIDILPYQGKSTELPKPLVDKLQRGGATVAVMMEPYFNENRKIVTDNFFNSPTLSRMLLENGTFMLGTVQKRRKGMPKMTGKLDKGQVKTYSDGQILLERWSDRREVVMMNTFIPHKMSYNSARNPVNSRNKPDSVLLYNKTMGAVDLMDKIIKPFSNHRKTYKWYKKVFFYLVDVAVYNTHKVYQLYHAGDKLSAYKDFLLNVIESILNESPKEISKRTGAAVSAPDEVPYHIPVRMGRSDCVWCRKTEAKRSVTQYKCSVCNVRLCLQKGSDSCYSSYHEELKTKTTKPKKARPVLAIIRPDNNANSVVLSGVQFPRTSTPIMETDVDSDSENYVVSQSIMDY